MISMDCLIVGVRSAKDVVHATDVVHAKDVAVSECCISFLCSMIGHRNGNKGSYVYDCVVYGRPIRFLYIYLMGTLMGGDHPPGGCDLVFIQRTLSMASMFL